MRFSIFVLLACWIMGAFFRPVLASCTINTPPSTTPMPIQLGNITAGSDNFSPGRVLYKQTYNLNFTGRTTVTCTSNTNQFLAVYSYSATPSGGPLPGAIGNIPAGKVYPTNINGIGVYIGQGTNASSNADNIVPTTKLASDSTGSVSGCASGSTCSIIRNFLRWDLYLVQTGPISSGVLQGSSLPCIQVNYNNTGSTSTEDGLVENVCITGSINIISPSCQTPDVVVPMGSYDVSSFNGKGSATKWIDASIKLLGCPIFYGSGSSGSWYADNSGVNNSGTSSKNSIAVQLTPMTTIIDSSRGIFALAESSDSARGAGIQLAYGTGSSPEIVNFSVMKSYQIGIGTNGISEIPLVARYIQTDTNVTPGTANSAVTFLINYY